MAPITLCAAWAILPCGTSDWLPAPADPESLEFAVEDARSRGGTLNLSLRLPVPAHARTDGMRVFEHYNAIVSPSKP